MKLHTAKLIFRFFITVTVDSTKETWRYTMDNLPGKYEFMFK